MHYIKEEINRLKTIGTLNTRGKAKLKEFEHLLELAESEFKNLTIPDVVHQMGQFKSMVFDMANELATAGYGDQAVSMHRIHNRL